jgi:hypothetical protein
VASVKTAQYRLGRSSQVLTLQLYAQAVSAAERDAADRIGPRLVGTTQETHRGSVREAAVTTVTA